MPNDSALIKNATISAADTITILYVSPASSDGTVIRSLTVSNNSPASSSYKAYIYDSDGVSVSAIVPMKVVVKDKFDSASSAVNQTIPAGGTLRAENSTADALNFYMSGLEQVKRD
jgi:uncharacterized protein YcfL